MGRRTSRNNLVVGEILERSAALFAKRGFSETSLQEVADAIGISRSALYHYVSSKEDLFVKLVSGLTRERANELSELRADGSVRPLDKIEAAIKVLATRVANNPTRFRLLIISEASLPDWVYEEHKTAKNELLDHLSAIIAEGVNAGVLKAVDERISAFTVLGMCNWIAWWYHPDHGPCIGDQRPSPNEVASMVTAMALDGLKREHERLPPESESGNVGRALDFLRQDLGYLERLLR